MAIQFFEPVQPLHSREDIAHRAMVITKTLPCRPGWMLCTVDIGYIAIDDNPR